MLCSHAEQSPLNALVFPCALPVIVSGAAAKQQPVEGQAVRGHSQRGACAPADPSASRRRRRASSHPAFPAQLPYQPTPAMPLTLCPIRRRPRSKDFEYEAFRFETERTEVIDALQKKKVRHPQRGRRH